MQYYRTVVSGEALPVAIYGNAAFPDFDWLSYYWPSPRWPMPLPAPDQLSITSWDGEKPSPELEKSVAHIEEMKASPDGRYIAMTSEYRVEVRDALTGDNVCFLRQPVSGRTEFEIYFSPDSLIIATKTMDSPVYLWSLPRGELVQTINALGSVESLVFASEFLLVGALRDEKLLICNYWTGEVVGKVELSDPLSAPRIVDIGENKMSQADIEQLQTVPLISSKTNPALEPEGDVLAKSYDCQLFVMQMGSDESGFDVSAYNRLKTTSTHLFKTDRSLYSSCHSLSSNTSLFAWAHDSLLNIIETTSARTVYSGTPGDGLVQRIDRLALSPSNEAICFLCCKYDGKVIAFEWTSKTILWELQMLPCWDQGYVAVALPGFDLMSESLTGSWAVWGQDSGDKDSDQGDDDQDQTKRITASCFNNSRGFTYRRINATDRNGAWTS